MINYQLLARVPLFKNLPQTELERLANELRVLDLPPDTLLFREGDRGGHFYIVLEGQLEVVKAMGTAEETVIGVHDPGGFFGEVSLMNPDGLRMASIRSRGAVRLWEMSHENLEALIQRRPSLTYEMVRVLSERLTSAHEDSIHDLREKNRQLTQAYEELKAAQAQVIEKERLERELQLAYEIQMSILPQTLPQVPCYDFGARIVPARAVGGDFYDVVQLSSDKVGIFVGDVTDKGVPSALFMAQTYALLYAAARPAATPRRVLRRVNQLLMKISASSLFVTVLYGVLDCKSGEFCYARAGHDVPILGAAPGQAQLAPWSQGQPLSLLDDPVLDEQTLTIPLGATLLLYTDGLIDGRSPEGEAFGLPRLQKELGTLIGRPAQAVCDHLWQTLAAYQQDTPQDDDVTIVVVRSIGK